MLDRTCHGFAASPVSSTTAAEVSSQDVSMPRISIRTTALAERHGFREGALQRLDVGRPEDAALRDNPGDEPVRCDVERGIPDERAAGRQLRAADARDLASASLFDRDAL